MPVRSSSASALACSGLYSGLKCSYSLQHAHREISFEDMAQNIDIAVLTWKGPNLSEGSLFHLRRPFFWLVSLQVFRAVLTLTEYKNQIKLRHVSFLRTDITEHSRRFNFFFTKYKSFGLLSEGG